MKMTMAFSRDVLDILGPYEWPQIRRYCENKNDSHIWKVK